MRQRIDKWLWHARLVRTRSAAAALVAAGVRVGGRRITAASQKVAIGDVVTLALGRSVKVVRVEGFSARRGDAAAARALYRDLTTGSGPKACNFAGVARKVSAPVKPTG